MKKDTKYSVLAVLSGLAVGGLLFGLELVGVDWADAGRKWFQLVLWTGFVFALVGYDRRKWLKRTKPLLLFFAFLALHVVVLVAYLRAKGQFPNVFFLIFAPLEVALLALLIGIVGGRIRLRKRPREEKGSG